MGGSGSGMAPTFSLVSNFGGYPGFSLPQGYGQSGYPDYGGYGAAQYGNGGGYGSVGAYGGYGSGGYGSSAYGPTGYGAPSYGYGVPSFGYGAPSYGYGSDPYAGMGYATPARTDMGYGGGMYPGGNGRDILGSSITNPADLDNDGVPDHLQETKEKIDDYLAKTYGLGKRRLSVQVEKLNTPLEYQFLQQYHDFGHPLAGTQLGNLFNIPQPAVKQVSGYSRASGYSQPPQTSYTTQTYGAPATQPTYSAPATPPSYSTSASSPQAYPQQPSYSSQPGLAY